MKKSTVAAALFLAMSTLGSAFAAPITLTLENPSTTDFQQTLNSPCVIGDPSCTNPVLFTMTTIPPNTSNYTLSSPTYTVNQIRSIVGDVFYVGIDVNTSTSPLATERLDFFGATIDGTLAYSYDPASPGTQLATKNNGNGYSDELLKGFNLTGLAGTSSIFFTAQINNATAGREEFFLITADGGTSVETPIPEPTTVALIGLGLLGFAASRRKSAKSKNA